MLWKSIPTMGERAISEFGDIRESKEKIKLNPQFDLNWKKYIYITGRGKVFVDDLVKELFGGEFDPNSVLIPSPDGKEFTLLSEIPKEAEWCYIDLITMRPLFLKKLSDLFSVLDYHVATKARGAVTRGHVWGRAYWIDNEANRELPTREECSVGWAEGDNITNQQAYMTTCALTDLVTHYRGVGPMCDVIGLKPYIVTEAIRKGSTSVISGHNKIELSTLKPKHERQLQFERQRLIKQ